jgi:hypothetical protein
MGGHAASVGAVSLVRSIVKQTTRRYKAYSLGALGWYYVIKLLWIHVRRGAPLVSLNPSRPVRSWQAGRAAEQ